jgi:hypothetical protein
MKLNLKGMEFNDISKIQQNLQPVLNDIIKKKRFSDMLSMMATLLGPVHLVQRQLF